MNLKIRCANRDGSAQLGAVIHTVRKWRFGCQSRVDLTGSAQSDAVVVSCTRSCIRTSPSSPAPSVLIAWANLTISFRGS